MEQPTRNPIHEGKHARKAFIALYVLMGVLALTLAVGVIYFVVETGRAAVGISAQDDEAAREAKDEDSSKAEPNVKGIDLVALIGQDADTAVAGLGHGAYIEQDRHISDDGLSRELIVPLANEKGTDRSGTPTVVLYADADNRVARASYEASFGAAGFGRIPLDEAVGEAAVIPALLKACGLDDVDDSTIVLPDDRASFSTYESDGRTLVTEEASFEGEGTAAGEPYEWSATLVYDYDEANAQGNLAYTTRTVSVTVSPA